MAKLCLPLDDSAINVNAKDILSNCPLAYHFHHSGISIKNYAMLFQKRKNINPGVNDIKSENQPFPFRPFGLISADAHPQRVVPEMPSGKKDQKSALHALIFFVLMFSMDVSSKYHTLYS